MSGIHWLNDVNGGFTNAADWRGGVVPGASDNAILDAAGSAFTVTSGVSETVRGVWLSSNATLSLTAAPVDAFVSAMAGLASPGGQDIHTDVAGLGRTYLLGPARAAAAWTIA